MKNFIWITITLLFSANALSEEVNSESDYQSPQVQWVKYLSDRDKDDIIYELGKETILRQQMSETASMPGPDEYQEVSFEASFTQTSTTMEDGRTTQAAASGGNIHCSINIQYPHAGTAPNNTIQVKAKSAGYCTYTHVTGTPPPTITWDLRQLLVRYTGGYPPMNTASHVRNGLNPVWSNSNTQVFSGTCINGTYSHLNSIYITPPPGWVYNGPQPLQIPDSVTVQVPNCPF